MTEQIVFSNSLVLEFSDVEEHVSYAEIRSEVDGHEFCCVNSGSCPHSELKVGSAGEQDFENGGEHRSQDRDRVEV